MEFKLLALDVDGTLVNSNRKITLKTERCIRRVIKNGLNVTLCTGRPIQGVKKYIDTLGITTPIITYNGAEIVDPKNDEVLFCKQLEYVDCMKIIELGKMVGTTLCIWSQGFLYGIPLNSRVENYKKISGVEPRQVDNIKELAKKGVTKIIWYDTEERINKFKDISFEFESVNFCTSNPCFLEFFNGEVSKMIAMQKLGEILNISAEHTVAIGDGVNDIPMLEYAGFSVAMGNASEEVKSVADCVVSDNDSDGVAEAIERFII